MSRRNRKNHGQPTEHKVLPILHVKVLDEDKGIVEEVVAVFGNIDHGKDRIMPGAFKKTINEGLGNILVLDQHNTNSIFDTLGIPLELREVGRQALPEQIRKDFPDATGGLVATTQYLMQTPEGKGAFERIKTGAIKQRSIGFDPQDMDYETVKARKVPTGFELDKSAPDLVIRNLRTIKLMEYSPVLWGMNEATATVSAKSADEQLPGASGGSEGDETPPPTEDKEMTPQGPIRRMGDVLVGSMSSMMGMVCGDWLSSGRISQEEHANLMSAFNLAMEGFNMAVDGEVAGRELPSPMFLFGRMGNNVTVLKADEAQLDEVKAGRMISAANQKELISAFQSLKAVLERAGFLDTSASDEDDEDQKAETVDAPAVSQPASVTLDGKGAEQEQAPLTPDLEYIKARRLQLLNIGGLRQ